MIAALAVVLSVNGNALAQAMNEELMGRLIKAELALFAKEAAEQLPPTR